MEPGPAALDVASSIVHRHLLFDFGSFGLSVSLEFLFALLAVFVVGLDFFVDFLDLLLRLLLALLDVVALALDAVHLSLALRLLLLILGNQLGHTLLQMLHDS